MGLRCSREAADILQDADHVFAEQVNIKTQGVRQKHGIGGQTMSRITDNEAIQAAKALEAYCESFRYCDECMFYVRSPVGCAIEGPYEWSIPDPDPEPAESRDSKRLREREEFFSGTYEERAQQKEDDAQERYLTEWKARREA